MNSGDTFNDVHIRRALHAKYLRRLKAHPETLVVDELGLAHARSRIDVAVINGNLHGYEIKSARDTLDRLNDQLEIYRLTLQKLTIVAAPRHISGIIARAPEWCGLVVATQGPRGGISFACMRRATVNPEVNPVMMAHLLWHTEVTDLLLQAGYAPRQLRRPRKQLYEMLCELLTLRELASSIRIVMKQRRAWRDHPVPALYDD